MHSRHHLTYQIEKIIKVKLACISICLFSAFNASSQDDTTLAKSEYYAAEEAYNLEDYDKCIDHLDKAEEYAGNNYLIQYLRVKSNYGLESYDDAKNNMKIFFEMIPKEKQDSRQYREIVKLLSKVNSRNEAMDIFNQIVGSFNKRKYELFIEKYPDFMQDYVRLEHDFSNYLLNFKVENSNNHWQTVLKKMPDASKLRSVSLKNFAKMLRELLNNSLSNSEINFEEFESSLVNRELDVSASKMDFKKVFNPLLNSDVHSNSAELKGLMGTYGVISSGTFSEENLKYAVSFDVYHQKGTTLLIGFLKGSYAHVFVLGKNASIQKYKRHSANKDLWYGKTLSKEDLEYNSSSSSYSVKVVFANGEINHLIVNSHKYNLNITGLEQKISLGAIKTTISNLSINQEFKF